VIVHRLAEVGLDLAHAPTHAPCGPPSPLLLPPAASLSNLTRKHSASIAPPRHLGRGSRLLPLRTAATRATCAAACCARQPVTHPSAACPSRTAHRSGGCRQRPRASVARSGGAAARVVLCGFRAERGSFQRILLNASMDPPHPPLRAPHVLVQSLAMDAAALGGGEMLTTLAFGLFNKLCIPLACPPCTPSLMRARSHTHRHRRARAHAHTMARTRQGGAGTGQGTWCTVGRRSVMGPVSNEASEAEASGAEATLQCR
jgi:hypothetical protein